MTRTKEQVEYTVKGKQVWDSDSTLVVECRYGREAQWLAEKLNAALAESRKAAVEECAKVAETTQYRKSEWAHGGLKIASAIRSLLLPGQPAEQVKDGDVCNGQCGAIGGPHIHGGPATEIKP